MTFGVAEGNLYRIAIAKTSAIPGGDAKQKQPHFCGCFCLHSRNGESNPIAAFGGVARVSAQKYIMMTFGVAAGNFYRAAIAKTSAIPGGDAKKRQLPFGSCLFF